MKSLFLKLFRPFHRVFLAKMPLEEFTDYNAYWQRRSEGAERFLYRFKYIANELPDDGRVFDIGCGDGKLLVHLQTQKPGLKLTGMDLSPVAIETIKQAGLQGFVHNIDTTPLPADLKADYVIATDVLEHLPNAEFAMKAMLSADAKRYYVSVPNLGHIEHRLRLALAGKTPATNIIYHIREHLRFWTVSDFKYWAQEMGYRVISYRGQYGTLCLWRFWPSLFAMGVIYVLEPKTDAPSLPKAKTRDASLPDSKQQGIAC